MRSRNAILNIITNIIFKIVMLIYTFIISKFIINKFGSNVNGLINSITNFLAYIALLESGFGPVIKSVLYKPIAKRDRVTIKKILNSSEDFFRKIAYLFIIYLIILLFIYPIINREFDFVFTSSLIIILSVSTFFEYYFGMTYKLYLQAEQKNYVISIIQVITYVLNILLIVILTRFNVSIYLVEIFSSFIFLLRPIIQNIYVKRKYNLIFFEHGKYKISQKWDALAQHIAYTIHINTDIVILTIFTNLNEVSVYSIYYLIIKGIKSIITTFITGIDASFGNMLAKKENIASRFGLYETIYFSICTIVFTTSFILITPFVRIYTSGVTDVNYVRYLFGYLIVISEFIWAIRQPYNELIKVAGHFKETRKGAWIECVVNIFISILLINKYGIVGVIIGTIVALLIRSVELIYHCNRYILDRKISVSIKKITIITIETLLIIFICKCLPYHNDNYMDFIINGLMTVIVSSIIVIGMNYYIYKNEFKDLFKKVSIFFNRKKA